MGRSSISKGQYLIYHNFEWLQLILPTFSETEVHQHKIIHKKTSFFVKQDSLVKKNGFHYKEWSPLKGMVFTVQKLLPLKGIDSTKGNGLCKKKPDSTEINDFHDNHWILIKAASTKRTAFTKRTDIH